MGDACGIGPEIIAQWWPGGREAVVVGCPKVMARAVNWMPAGQRPRVRELADLVGQSGWCFDDHLVVDGGNDRGTRR